MPIEKGQPWGRPGCLGAGGVVVVSDAEARDVLEAARREGRPYPSIGVLGGDLARTLGAPGDRARLHSEAAVSFSVDVGEVLLDGRLHLFVAHLVARSPTWRRSFVAMNAQWRGRWNLGPRAHPGDGLLDIYDAHLRLADLAKVRARLHHGAHLPHPRIKQRRAPAVQVDLGSALMVELDGVAVGRARELCARVAPDALEVVV